MKNFDFLDHGADIGIVAYGEDLKEVFTNAAHALFSLIADGEVREELCHEVEAQAEDNESLLVVWLNELIYLFDTRNMLFSRFEISELSGTRLKATGYGEEVDPSRHELKTGVKAATYHMLELKREDGYRVQVIFDV